MSKTKFYPGWKMTTEQHGRYWRDVSAVARCLRTATQEEARQLIHQRAFGGPKSARTINHLKEFDNFIAAVKALLQPANLEAQLRQAEMPNTRLIYAIRQLAPEAYIIAEARRKFATEDWPSLGESDLTMLRNHLAARAAAIRWPQQAAAGPEEDVPVVNGAECPF